MIASIASASLVGAEGRRVLVEVHVSNGPPRFSVLGRPDAACRTVRERVRAALLSSGLPWPMRRVTVGLALPALRTSGSGLDLAIAAGVLVTSGVLPTTALLGVGLVAELGFNGSLRSVPGLVSLVEGLDGEQLVVPVAGAAELAVLDRRRLRPFATLRELVEVLRGGRAWPSFPELVPGGGTAAVGEGLSDVVGQRVGRFALEVAAAGAHHLLLVGPPARGRRCSRGAFWACSRVSCPRRRSRCGGCTRRPGCCCPSASRAGRHHCGPRTTRSRPSPSSEAGAPRCARGRRASRRAGCSSSTNWDSSRPRSSSCCASRSGRARSDSRARVSVVLPARFLLVATASPCPCGGTSRLTGACGCSPADRRRDACRLPGPLFDRFDLRVRLEAPAAAEVLTGRRGESSAAVAGRVAAARALARARGVCANASIPDAELASLAPLDRSARAELERALEGGSCPSGASAGSGAWRAPSPISRARGASSACATSRRRWRCAARPTRCSSRRPGGGSVGRASRAPPTSRRAPAGAARPVRVSFPWRLCVRARLAEPVGPRSLAALEELAGLATRAGADAVLLAPGPSESAGEAWVLAGALAVALGEGDAPSEAVVGPLGPPIDELSPALLAKMATTLDVVSKGRALCGVVPDGARDAERFAEALEVCRALLAVPSPSFAGRHYRLEAAANEPRLSRAPGEAVPVVAAVASGAGSEALVRAAATFADAVVLDLAPGAEDGVRLTELAREAARRSGRTGGRPSLLAVVAASTLEGLEDRDPSTGGSAGERDVLEAVRRAARAVAAGLPPGVDGVVIDAVATPGTGPGPEAAGTGATEKAGTLSPRSLLALGGALRDAVEQRRLGRRTGPREGR